MMKWRRMYRRFIKWGNSEVNHPVNESLRNEKVDRLFQRNLSGQTPNPYFFI